MIAKINYRLHFLHHDSLGNNLETQFQKHNLVKQQIRGEEWFELSANVSPNRINPNVSGTEREKERRWSFIFVYPQGTPAKYTRATRLCALLLVRRLSLPSNVQQRRISTHLWSALLAFSSPARSVSLRAGAIHHEAALGCRHQNRRRRRSTPALSRLKWRTARIKNSYT